MDLRKQKEAKFHNQLRDKELKKDTAQHRYLTSNKKFYSIARKSEQFVKNHLIRNCAGKKTLDYCCGNGELVFLLAQQGAEAFGVDISSVSIENCQQEALKKGLEKNAKFLVMDAENLKFADNYFDLIICNGVLHHLDINKAYSELAKVLKPEGKIVCDEPLIHNPIFQLYRRRTPHLRTQWEATHILSKNDIILAKNYFGEIETKFFHLFTLLAVPFRNLPCFSFFLGILERIDSVILKIPFIKWWAWQVVFILAKPKKNVR